MRENNSQRQLNGKNMDIRLSEVVRFGCFGLAIILWMVMVSPPVYAIFNQLQMGASARAMGMGGAFTAVSDDASGIVYNPAGLRKIKKYELFSSYVDLFPEIRDDKVAISFVSGAIPLKNIGTAGVAYLGLNSKLMDQEAFYFSFGGKVWRRVSGGINVKYLRVRAKSPFNDPLFTNGKFSSSGIAMDLGGMWDVNDQLTLGASFENLLSPNLAKSLNEKVPATLRGGMAYHVTDRILLSTEITSRNGEARYSAGGEVWWKDFAVRAGIFQGNLTAGAGFKFIRGRFEWELDYGFMNHPDLEFTHRFSTNMRF